MNLFNKQKNKSTKEEKEGGTIAEKRQRVQSLSAREYEAFQYLLQGYTLRSCAEKMGIKFSTVNTYQNSIYKKLDVNNRATLIIRYKELF